MGVQDAEKGEGGGWDAKVLAEGPQGSERDGVQGVFDVYIKVWGRGWVRRRA